MLETIRAKAGATLLDIIRPGWAAEVRPEKLDMYSCHSCVLGQLYGYYSHGAELLFATAGDINVREGQSARAGFVSDRPDYWETYSRLTKAWRREIAKRVG